jgi:hypothetical protein
MHVSSTTVTTFEALIAKVMAKISLCLIEHHGFKRYEVRGQNPLVQQMGASVQRCARPLHTGRVTTRAVGVIANRFWDVRCWNMQRSG